MKKMISMFAMSALLVSMASCTDDNGNGGGGDEVDLKPIPLAYSQVQQTEFAQQSNKFANKLMAVFSADPEKQGENVCVAPMSMQYVLSILANGAEAALQKEMVEAMGFDDIASINEENLSLLNKLAQDDEYVTVGFCNSMWIDENLSSYQPTFKSTVEQYYKAKLGILPFSRDIAYARQQIAQWAKENTDSLITDIPVKTSIETQHVENNANFFDGKWTNPFNPAHTEALPFYNIDGNQRNVMTMYNTAEISNYADDSLQMAELPYGQGYYSMMVVMPKKSEYLNDIIKNADWWGWHNLMAKGKARVTLPRFSVMSEWDNLVDLIPKLGIVSINDKKFTHIVNNYELGLDALSHSVVLKVDENGTKAAAISSGQGGLLSPGPTPNLTFDHPFIYAIRENTTGAILFMGKVVKL